MSDKYLLGLDIGTHGSKGAIVDISGNIVAIASCEHKLIIPQPGYAEHDANMWWNDFVKITKTLIRESKIEPSKIKAIGCSAIAPTMLPLDKDGIPLRNAILYGVDSRAAVEIDELNSKIGENLIIEKTGMPLSSQSVGPKILWYKKNELELFSRTKKIVTASTYIVYKLTGKFFIDYYTAMAFLPLFDYKNKKWSTELWPDFNLDLLPEIAWSSQTVGVVSRKSASETGLMCGTKVITGTADASAEAVSVGVVEKGDLMVMYGTSGFFIQIANKFPQTTKLWPAIYLTEGQYALLGGMSTVGALINWYKDLIGNYTYDKLNSLADRIKPGSEGIVILPYFSGARTPINNPNARGIIFGLSLYHKKEHIYRAILESIGYGIKDNVVNIEKQGLPIKKMVAIGGGINSQILLQVVSDITKIGQKVPKTKEGACYGDAFLAGLGIGYFKSFKDVLNWVKWEKEIIPNKNNFSIYNKLYRIYKDIYKNTYKINNRLKDISK